MTLIYIQNIFHVLYRNMTSKTCLSIIPNNVRGMKVLDREKFLRNIKVPILKVREDKLSKITPICKSYFLKLENFKPIQNLEGNTNPKKCIYLNPEKVTQWSDISQEDRTKLNHQGISDSSFDIKDTQFTYDNWKFDTIFKAVLPEDEEIVSSFSQIGHIIHLNLRDHLLEYSSLIGQVLVDKIKTCRTVVNKSNIIDNTYRNFNMEVIAGENDFIVTVKENCCNFQFDFSKVYWNPRLAKEHERIISYLQPGDVLFDVFCGVGPFSIPAAKRKCTVFANDLNPDSFKWLNLNAKINKLNMSFFKSYNQDGKDFICEVLKSYLIDYCKGQEKINNGAKIHITMNLPAMAVEFLKCFKGLLKDESVIENFDCEIIVYVYCFAVGEDSVSVAKQMVNDNIGIDMTGYIIDVFDVRNVSPKKEMMRVTFKLTKEIIFYNSDCEPPCKKLCVQDTK